MNMFGGRCAQSRGSCYYSCEYVKNSVSAVATENRKPNLSCVVALNSSSSSSSPSLLLLRTRQTPQGLVLVVGITPECVTEPWLHRIGVARLTHTDTHLWKSSKSGSNSSSEKLSNDSKPSLSSILSVTAVMLALIIFVFAFLILVLFTSVLFSFTLAAAVSLPAVV